MYSLEQVRDAIDKDPIGTALSKLEVFALDHAEEEIARWARAELEGFQDEKEILSLWDKALGVTEQPQYDGGFTPEVRKAADRLPAYRRSYEVHTSKILASGPKEAWYLAPIIWGVRELEREHDNMMFRSISGSQRSIRLDSKNIDRLFSDIQVEARRKLSLLSRAKRTASSERQDQPATKLGPWRILSRLPGGSQGDVYLVERDFPEATKGVLKRLRKERLGKHKDRVRFLREIATLKKLQHPCIVRILGTSTTDPEPWLVMELAPLGSLHQHVPTIFKGDAWRTLRMARDVASALQSAHLKKIIHRDIKPKNILLRDLDHVIVADFGVAHNEEETSVSDTDERVGPQEFAPPEYFEGHIQPTPSFDVYCLGGVIYYALSGGRLLRRQRHDMPECDLATILSNPNLKRVNSLLDKMLAPKKENRLQTMEEVIREIDINLSTLFVNSMAPPEVSVESKLSSWETKSTNSQDKKNKALQYLTDTAFQLTKGYYAKNFNLAYVFCGCSNLLATGVTGPALVQQILKLLGGDPKRDNLSSYTPYQSEDFIGPLIVRGLVKVVHETEGQVEYYILTDIGIEVAGILLDHSEHRIYTEDGKPTSKPNRDPSPA